METKITKRDNFATLRSMVETADISNEEMDRLLIFIDHEVEQLDKRSANSKKYAKKTAAATDALTELVRTALALNSDPKTIAQIVTLINDATEGVATAQKVTYRLTQLVKSGEAEKSTISVKDGDGPARRVNAYALAAYEAADADAE